MTTDSDIGQTRRAALTALALAGAAALAGRASAATASAAAEPSTKSTLGRVVPVPTAFAGRHVVAPLPFRPNALKGLSARLITSHHDNNYAGAVRNLNRVESELAHVSAETPPFVVAALRERELTFRNSKSLHEAYFANLGGDGRLTGAIARAIDESYGSAQTWEQHMRATGLGLGGGSGWVVLGLELDTGALRTVASSHHTQALTTSVPLLVLDMYEHSYQMDFGADTGRYIEAFFANVDWEEVDRRFDSAQRMSAIARGPL